MAGPVIYPVDREAGHVRCTNACSIGLGHYRGDDGLHKCSVCGEQGHEWPAQECCYRYETLGERRRRLSQERRRP